MVKIHLFSQDLLAQKLYCVPSRGDILFFGTDPVGIGVGISVGVKLLVRSVT